MTLCAVLPNIAMNTQRLKKTGKKMEGRNMLMFLAPKPAK